ncbi:MAG: hypothetical protein AB7G28_02810 [Pirellulales bacterium]
MNQELLERFTEMAVDWSVDVNGTPPRDIKQAMDQLLKHVLRSAMSCNEPTTDGIAAIAGICPECCETVLQVAQEFGLMEFEPATCAS